MSADLHHVFTQLEHSDSSLLAPFAQQLYAKADEGLLATVSEATLVAMARDALAFLQRARTPGPTVEVLNPTLEGEGYTLPYTLLRLSLTDRPFIVESVRTEIHRQGLTIAHVLHPTFLASRDADGRVTRVADRRAAAPAGASSEALELWLVEPITDSHALDALAGGVTRVLHDVVCVTDDFSAMLERSRALSSLLRAESDTAEFGAFLDWLEDGHFVYLGYRRRDLIDQGGDALLQVDASSSLGVYRSQQQAADPEDATSGPLGDRRKAWLDAPVLRVTKAELVSRVRRASRMERVRVKSTDAAGRVTGEHEFVGLFNNRAYSQTAANVPILRSKLRAVLDLDGALPGSHDYKQMVMIFDTLPRLDVLWADAPSLHRDVRAIMGLQEERGVRLLVRPDAMGRGLSVTVRLPRDRFNAQVRQRLQAHLMRALSGTHVDYQLTLGEDEAYARLHFFITTEVRAGDVDAKGLESEVMEIARTWDDHLHARLRDKHGAVRGMQLSDRFTPAFDARYRADTHAAQALADIDAMEALTAEEGAIAVAFGDTTTDPQVASGRTMLRVYRRGGGMVLSSVLPILENLGFRVFEQVSYPLFTAAGDRFGIDVFKLDDGRGRSIDLERDGKRLTEAALHILRGESEHDRLSRLVLHGSLTVREVALLRALRMLMVQISAATSREFVTDTLLAYPQCARLLVERFNARFDPALPPAGSSERVEAERAAQQAFHDSLAAVHSLPADQVLRGLSDLISAMVRSDYHRHHRWIAFKLESAKVSWMPFPRPLYEVAVAAPEVEGVHLRGGKVARGGIRWSDRPDDFRTEVLGLMKTQMTKNAVIVPVGSKGGFVVKGAPDGAAGGGDALRAFVRQQYRVFIGALLGLTDNMHGDTVVHPDGLVVHDGPDPYLVVAADKGTATFSDLANEVAASFNFWLGDAFASGGSVGYDHKKVGITARGAWAAIRRHFRDLNLNPDTDAFTAVGIGDMSGDVFGNGMLATPQLRLLAAFDHRHIFIDPNPNAAAAFAERQRLFALPRSAWADYNPALISAGGGVFERGAKSIELSAQARSALQIDEATLSGEGLIRAILRAPVDLLWNGGIGTYVKASSERHADVGDASNDGVRVDANSLRARVVAEGGNLGFTQAARIEYARKGGRIHTDAIDNAGGVDLSDHEVNLKLALQPMMVRGTLTSEERVRLLRAMEPEVATLVLRDNARQALALALAQRRSMNDLALFDDLIAYLAAHGGLDPVVEHLPSQRQLVERERAGEGLTRPELAVVMAYVKMGLFRRLLETDLPDEPVFRPVHLDAYFPSELRERHPDAIHQHPLRREIAATMMTNRVVDLLGMTFVHRTIRDTGATPVEVMRAALMALEALDVAAFEARLEEGVAGVPGAAELDALEVLVHAVEESVRWMLFNGGAAGSAEAFIERHRVALAVMRADLATFLPTPERRRMQASARKFERAGFATALATELAAFDYLPSSMGVIDVAERTGQPLADVATLFFALGERLHLGRIRDNLRALPASDSWTKMALVGVVMELRQAQRDLCERWALARRENSKLGIEAFLRQTPRMIARFDEALARIEGEDAVSLASAGVLTRLLRRRD